MLFRTNYSLLRIILPADWKFLVVTETELFFHYVEIRQKEPRHRAELEKVIMGHKIHKCDKFASMEDHAWT